MHVEHVQGDSYELLSAVRFDGFDGSGGFSGAVSWDTLGVAAFESCLGVSWGSIEPDDSPERGPAGFS